MNQSTKEIAVEIAVASAIELVEQPWPTPEQDREVMAAAVAKLMRRYESAANFTVWPAPRKPKDAQSDPGWLEWGVRVEFESRNQLFIGLVQRKPGDEVESHS